MFPLWNDSECACEDLERVERCYKLLLDAGSDIPPTTPYDDGFDDLWISAFSKALYRGTLVRRLSRDSVDAMQLIISRQN